MALSYEYFQAINNGVGSNSLVEIDIAESKRRLRQQLQGSNHYDPEATRNGVTQGLVVTASDSMHKYRVEALPDEELYAGDLIYTHDHYWIVIETRVASPYQTIGIMWLCNHLFRWQNGTSKIIERWGVLDSGVYSSTKDGDKTVETADKQYKIYLPRDNDTIKLYVDKRFATEVIYDQSLKEILNVYAITGVDPTSRSYGNNSHLLVLNARSDDYVAGRDNLTERICDYIAPTGAPYIDEPLIITGSTKIPIGSSRMYAVDCEDPVWFCDYPSGVHMYQFEDGSMMLKIDYNEELVGESFMVEATDGMSDGSLIVEVID